MENMTKMKINLFELARSAILYSGGDGTVIIVSKQYQKLADDFEKYEKEHNNYFIKREEYNNGTINFSPNEEHSQEGISFSYDISVRNVFGCYELVITAMDIFD